MKQKFLVRYNVKLKILTVNSINSFTCFDLFLPHVAIYCLLTVGTINIYLLKDI